MSEQEDAARKEEARLLKTMARRGPPPAKAVGKAPAVAPSASSGTGKVTGSVNGGASRAGAPLPRSSSYAPSGTTPVVSAPYTAASSAKLSVGTSDSISEHKTSPGGNKVDNTSGKTSSMQKSPSFGSSRNIITRTVSTGPSSSSTVQKSSGTVDEDAIRRREAEFEAERERLRQVEQSLIKNTKNVLGDMGEINSEAERQELARLEREKAQKEKEMAQQPSKPIKAPAPAETAPKAQAKPAPSSGESWNVNKSLIDDVDALLAQLNQAANQMPSSSSSAKDKSIKNNPKFEQAKDTLRTRKASIPTFVSMAMGATLPEDLDSALAAYIREITISMKPVQEQVSQIPLVDETFDFIHLANSLDILLLKIVTDIHLLLDHNSRELVSNYSMELVDKAIMLMQDIHEQSPLLSSPPSSSTGPSPDDIILSSQNKFILFLKHLAQSLTTAAKKQIEDMQAKRDKNSALAQCVQETALHAQSLAQILKEPLFEPQAFKDKLASLVTTVKRAAPLLSPGPQHDTVMDCTRRVLEASLHLQDVHQSGAPISTADSSSPHIQVFHAIGDLLRAILATIQNK